MKKFFKSKLFGFIILMILAIVTVISGASSFSRYEMNYHDEIIAEYADFCFSHDGDGKSTILTTINESGYDYEGFMSVSVVNKIEKDGEIEVSSRLIAFTMRTPTAAEHTAKEIKDVWGTKVADITSDTIKYDIKLTNEYGDPLGTNVSLGNLVDDVVQEESKTVNLSIKRKDGYGELNSIEYITVVIETSIPYKNTIAFTIAVSHRKILFTTSEKDYFGFTIIV